jgi:hypothetical protein
MDSPQLVQRLVVSPDGERRWQYADRGLATARSKQVSSPPSSTLIKKKIKFSSYIRKFRNGAVAKSYMTNGVLIYGEIFAHFLIYSIRKPFLIYYFATAPL